MSCLAPGLGSLARCRQGGCRQCRALCRCWAVLWEPPWWEQAQAGDGARAWGVNAAKVCALGVCGTAIARALTCLCGGEKAFHVLWG